MDTLCDYSLVITQAVSADAAAGMFGPINTAMKSCANNSLSVGFDMKHLNRGLSAKQKESVAGYLENGMRSNFESLFSYIGNEFYSQKNTVVDVISVPKVGVYHPDHKTLITSGSEEFYGWLESKESISSKTKTKPVIAVLIHRSAIENEQTAVVDATINAIEKQGGRGFAVFFDGVDAHKGFRSMVKGQVHAMINYRMLHEAEKNKQDFEDIAVPVLHGLVYRDGDRKSFDEADAGISAMMSPYFLMMPESAGLIDPTMVATVRSY